MEVGLRELRQQASELVRRVEAGASITVTVSGRPAARLVPAQRDVWRTFDEVQELFAGPADRDWERDRDLLDGDPRNPGSAGEGSPRHERGPGLGVPALPGELAVSATLAELYFGVLATADPATRAERLRRLALRERSFVALPVDERVARSYGRLAAAVAQAGRQPRARVVDLLIAAEVHAHDAKLYPANAKDLRGLEDLGEIVEITTV